MQHNVNISVHVACTMRVLSQCNTMSISLYMLLVLCEYYPSAIQCQYLCTCCLYYASTIPVQYNVNISVRVACRTLYSLWLYATCTGDTQPILPNPTSATVLRAAADWMLPAGAKSLGPDEMLCTNRVYIVINQRSNGQHAHVLSRTCAFCMY